VKPRAVCFPAPGFISSIAVALGETIKLPSAGIVATEISSFSVHEYSEIMINREVNIRLSVFFIANVLNAFYHFPCDAFRFRNQVADPD
jgi:hypothetical protein